MTPLALEILLWIEPGRRMAEFPTGHHAKIDIKVVSATLVIDGLMSDDPMAPDEGPHITPRGEAYLAMLLATPLPVQQWVDPRAGGVNIGEFTGYPMTRVAAEADGRIVKSTSPITHPGRDDGVRVFETALNPSPEQKAAAYAATVPKPPEGFTHHLGLSSKMPDGLKPGDDIEVWYRDGKSGKQAKIGKRADVLAAASINWQHRGGDDDVIGYRPMEMATVTKIVMPKR